MSLKLHKIEPPCSLGVHRATYEVTHSKPAPGGGTVLSQTIILRLHPDNTNADISIEGCDAPTPAEALARLAQWLRRRADGSDEHKGQVTLPL